MWFVLGSRREQGRDLELCYSCGKLDSRTSSTLYVQWVPEDVGVSRGPSMRREAAAEEVRDE